MCLILHVYYTTYMSSAGVIEGEVPFRTLCTAAHMCLILNVNVNVSFISLIWGVWRGGVNKCAYLFFINPTRGPVLIFFFVRRMVTMLKIVICSRASLIQQRIGLVPRGIHRCKHTHLQLDDTSVRC